MKAYFLKGNNFVVPRFYIFLFIISFNGSCNSIKYGNAERMNSISLDISFEDWELLPALDIIFSNHSLLFFSFFSWSQTVRKARWLLNNKLLLFFFQWLSYHLSFFYFLLIIYVFFLYILRQLVELFKFYVKKWSLIIWEAHAISWSVLKKYFQSRAPRLLLSVYILCIYDLIRLYASERFVNFNPLVPDVRKMVKHTLKIFPHSQQDL